LPAVYARPQAVNRIAGEITLLSQPLEVIKAEQHFTDARFLLRCPIDSRPMDGEGKYLVLPNPRASGSQMPATT
jgi:hypothetical protein